MQKDWKAKYEELSERYEKQSKAMMVLGTQHRMVVQQNACLRKALAHVSGGRVVEADDGMQEMMEKVLGRVDEIHEMVQHLGDDNKEASVATHDEAAKADDAATDRKPLKKTKDEVAKADDAAADKKKKASGVYKFTTHSPRDSNVERPIGFHDNWR
eukprot:TRINITY_DN3807_c1_g1_i1.p2 TRINITY_DN3807_c1_g1~~TRINITY_DN3807_c1_g1_i1.p2  ORF type:complete len:157 (+),score=58.13 TRINITY_DN3807_c1_g1_i1:39-509(+)